MKLVQRVAVPEAFLTRSQRVSCFLTSSRQDTALWHTSNAGRTLVSMVNSDGYWFSVDDTINCYKLMVNAQWS